MLKGRTAKPGSGRREEQPDRTCRELSEDNAELCSGKQNTPAPGQDVLILFTFHLLQHCLGFTAPLC